MAEILILGAGAMGSAFAFPAADAGTRVRLVGTHLDDEWIRAVRETGRHPKLGTPFPDGVVPYLNDELEAALGEDISMIVLGVSSPGVTWAVERLLEHRRRLPRKLTIMMLTKGLTAGGDGIGVLPDAVAESFSRAGFSDVSVGGVGGPCIASELANRRDSGVVFAARGPELLKTAMAATACSYYHVTGSSDVIGVEACAAFKNFYAIGVGFAGAAPDQPGAYNPAAALFTQAVREMAYLIGEIGGGIESVNGLPGTGDLYVTCQAGRNSRMGRLLGSGITYREARRVHMPDDTVEGADLALSIGPVLEGMMEEGRLDRSRLPLATELIGTICRDEPLTIPWASFG